VLLALSINRVWIFFNHLVDLREVWEEANAIQGDLDTAIFIPIVSIFLKWLRFKYQIKLK
jgi:hypothetical protein